jgi:glycosyltransferase involved in cell wall biosynthesis
MRILMLERNVLLDRRVVLMSRSLIEAGHDVQVVHEQPHEGWMERMDVDLHTVPMPSKGKHNDGYGGNGVLTQPDFVRETNNRFRVSKHRLYEKEQQSRTGIMARSRGPRWRGNLEVMLRNPWVTADKAKEEMKGRPIARRLLRAVLWPLALPTKLRLLKESEYSSLAPAGMKLDYWDKCVLSYIEHSWRPDVICANDYPTLRVAVAAKKRLGCEIVYDAHELYAYQPGMEFERSKLIFREERALLRYVDHGIVLNTMQANIMRRDSQWKGEYATCPNATSVPEEFDINVRHNRVRERLGIPEDHKIMMFQGGINKARRTHYILQGMAQARTKNVHMVFLTFGSEIEEFRQLAFDLGLASRVHFLPFVPWEEIIYWAASAECGMLPYAVNDQNSAIGSPNKMFEFINAGTPMIGPWNIPGIRDMLDGEGFGLTAPLYTVEDFAHVIDKFFDEKNGGWKRFRPALIEKSHIFHWDNQVNGVLEMYERLAERIDKKASKGRLGGSKDPSSARGDNATLVS